MSNTEMDIQEIRDFSKKTKKTAESILREAGIEQILSKYGRVVVGGSFAFDLMYGPDIDITVETKDPRVASLNVLNDLLKGRKFQKYEYGDFAAHPRKNRPESYIVNVRSVFEGRKWEIEVWFFEKINPKEAEEIEKMIKLTPTQKDSILKIKHQREEANVSKHELSSMRIYQEVIDNKAQDLEDIEI